jgi:UDP-arabinose 4-epimerase
MLVGLGSNGVPKLQAAPKKMVQDFTTDHRKGYVVLGGWGFLVVGCMIYLTANLSSKDLPSANSLGGVWQDSSGVGYRDQALGFAVGGEPQMGESGFNAQTPTPAPGGCEKVVHPSFVPMVYHRKQEGRDHVLLTGGAGYIGSHATLRLLRDDHAVTIIDNLSRGNQGAVDALMAQAKPGQLRFINMDLANTVQLNALFVDSDFKIVVHFAAVAYVGESYKNPLLYYKNVTANTMNLLYAMELGGVKRLVYSSTCATYGNTKEQPITERTPQAPVSPYGQSKLACEKMIIEYEEARTDFSAVILRYFNVIGSDPDGIVGEAPHAAEAKMYGRITAGCFDAALGHSKGMPIMGTDHDTPDGTCIRDYIHVVDLVDAHIKAFNVISDAKGAIHIYNVGVGKGYSVKEFVVACKKVTGVDIKVVHKDSRPGDAAKVFADPTKVKEELEWEPVYTDLTESLKTAWEWTRKHPHGYSTNIEQS